MNQETYDRIFTILILIAYVEFAIMLIAGGTWYNMVSETRLATSAEIAAATSVGGPLPVGGLLQIAGLILAVSFIYFTVYGDEE